MFCRTYSASLEAAAGKQVAIEGVLYRGLPRIQMAGLPSDVVRESRDRVQATLRQLGHRVPSGRIALHLYPAEMKKQGSQFDLAFAMLLLFIESKLGTAALAMEQCAFLGELALCGQVRKVDCILPLLEPLLESETTKAVFVPQANAQDVSYFASSKVKLVSHLSELIDFFQSGVENFSQIPRTPSFERVCVEPSLDDVRGQSLAKRALQVAIAGRHHTLLVGPPGVGKSMLARASRNLLSAPQTNEIFQIVKMHGYFRKDIRQRPFQAPHHSSSAASILGGGTKYVLPGEVSLASGGVLFLDEIAEFRRDVLEGLREPMQEFSVSLRRVGHAIEFPARFTLIAAMNPCPCGKATDRQGACHCEPRSIRRYLEKISGPILDRFEIYLGLGKPSDDQMGTSQSELQEQVDKAESIQQKRYQGEKFFFNGEQSVLRHSGFKLSSEDKVWLREKCDSLALSERVRVSVHRVARTIADLGGSVGIQSVHLQEALLLRSRSLVSES